MEETSSSSSKPAGDESPPIVTVRAAQPGDERRIASFIHPFIEERKLLPRTESELDELISNGFVALLEDRVVGFSALEIYSAKLAEIRSLATAPEIRGWGVGKRLVQACVQRAQDAGVLEVLAITSSEEFFKHCGFDFTLPGEKKALFFQPDTSAGAGENGDAGGGGSSSACENERSKN